MSTLRLEYIDPATLDGHPSNWKVHTAEQLAVLDSLKRRVGFAGALLYNERTKRLLDGHGRKEQWAGQPVPVLIGSWTEDEEREILLGLDPTGWMGSEQLDSKLLAELLEAEKAFTALEDDPSLKAMFEDLETAAELAKPDEPAEKPAPAKPAKSADVPDILWPTDNAFGVPLLDPTMQADAAVFPVTTWGSIGRSRPMAGTYHFYTADEQFESLWHNPAAVFKSGCQAVTEVNYSTHDQTPFALALWAVYRKRWLARYWQSQGLRVFVDLNVHHDLLGPHEAAAGAVPALLGVPAGWKAFSTRAHGNRPAALLAEFDVARRHSGIDQPLFLVVGGGRAVESLAHEHGWNWVPDPLDPTRKGAD